MEAVIDRLRSEVEHCDHFGGLLLLQSLAGGTGAGLGSRVAEEMSMHFPSALQLSYAVWPYDSGEVLVQAYNTLLSVNKLLATCDGLILTRNEDLAATCAVRSHSALRTIKEVLFVYILKKLCHDCTAYERIHSVSQLSGSGYETFSDRFDSRVHARWHCFQ